MKRTIVIGLIGTAAGATLLAGAAGATAGAAGSGLPTMTIALNGSSIHVGGSLVSGAVDVVSTTTGVRDAEPTLFRLDPGVTVGSLVKFLSSPAGADPNGASKLGSIVFDADAPRGTSHVQTSLQPGSYVAIDTESLQSQGPGSGPAKAPPITTFTIAPSSHPASLPAPGATLQTIEFGFRGPAVLHRGELVRFENSGFLVHMVVAIQARSAGAAHQIVSLLRAGKDNQAMHLAANGLSWLGPVSGGGMQQLRLSAAPGTYVLACFMDTQDGREHTQLGMERIVHVVK